MEGVYPTICTPLPGARRLAINKRKVLEAARKHAQKGAQAKALKEFEKLLKLDPRDARLRLEVGDAHRRWGNVDKAIETYAKVADQYMKEGFDARAVAVYKQIHNLDPEAFATYEPLAELYQRMGLVAEAILALQTAADGYHKQGKKREALELLRKMATLDSTNTTSRVKVGDLLKQEKLYEEAISEYEEASAELERQGDLEGASKTYERILEIDPARSVTLTKLSENLVKRGLPDRAEPMVKRLLEASPDDPACYELMASVYRAQQRDDDLVDTYRKLSDVHRRRGDEEKARDILQRFVPSEEFQAELGIDEATAFGAMSSDIDLGESGTFSLEGDTIGNLTLGESAAEDSAAESDVAEQTRFDPMALEPESRSKLEDDFLAVDGDQASSVALDGEGPEEISLELDTPIEEPVLDIEEVVAEPRKLPTGDPEQLLAEASVYLRYGKRDQAIANLEGIVEMDSEHRPALEKLGEAYGEAGQGPRAVETWLRAAELASAAGDVEGVSVLRDRIGAIDEAAAAALVVESAAPEPATPSAAEDEPTALPLDAVGSEPDAAADAHEIDLDDIEIDLDDSDFEEAIAAASDEAAVEEISFGDDIENAADADQAPDASDVAGPGASSSMAEQISEDLEEADFYMKQGLADEAEVIYKRVLSIAPNHPRALVRLGEVAAMRGEDPGGTGAGAAAAANADTTPELQLDSDTEGIDVDADLDSFSSDIPGPDDPELVATDDADPDEESADEARADRPAESAVEDGLAAQFLAEVSGPMESDDADATEDESAIDSDLGEDRAPMEEEPAEDVGGVAPQPVAPAIDSVAAAGGSGGDPSLDSEEFDDTDDSLASPDDSFDEPEQELGDPPDLGVSEPEPGFDLAAELNDALDTSSGGGSVSGLGDSGDGFAAVFSEFKKGVSKALSEGDHEAHFDLGIAYREMGLYEDAKGEFRAAMRNPKREAECRHMLGLVYFEQEQLEEAVAEFEQITASEVSSEEQVLSAQFELGRSWQALGETERARQAFESVVALDPDFCDVSAHLAALEELPKDEEDVAEQGFESFEDLISDDAHEVETAAASDSGSDPATAEYESFDDFLSDDDDPPAAEAGEAAFANPPTAAEPALDEEPIGESEVLLEPELQPEPPPEPEPEPAAEPAPEPKPEPAAEPAPEPKPRKRKKISFV